MLFVASEALGVERLAALTGAAPGAVRAALGAIAEDFADRGMVLREIAGGYRFASSAAARAAVEAYLVPPKTTLSPAAMETLAVVAYLQPATRAEIEAVRGVQVDGIVATLVDRGFIAEIGRRDVPGRPAEYRTTATFLESFGLRDLGELPVVDLEPAHDGSLPVRTAPTVPEAGPSEETPSKN